MKIHKLLTSIILLTVILFGSKSDAENYKVVSCNSEIDRCIVRNTSLKYGIYTKAGKQILPCIYSDIDEAEYSNFLVRTKDLKMGLVNKDGVFLLKPEYLSITKSRKDGKYSIQPNWDNLFGIADMKTGHIDIAPKYDFIMPFENGAYRIDKDEKSGVINADLKQIIPVDYYFITLLPANLYYRLHKQDAKDIYGIADINGKIIVPVDCDWIDKNPSSFKQRVVRNGKTYIFNSQTGKLTAK